MGVVRSELLRGGLLLLMVMEEGLKKRKKIFGCFFHFEIQHESWNDTHFGNL